MDLGFNFNKFKNAITLEAKTSRELLTLIKSINCHVEVIQIYHDGVNHIAVVITEKKIIRKIK